MRTLYIVTYDIRDDRRLRRVFRLMRGYGDHLQYSVFRCELSDRERAELILRLTEVMRLSDDQALFFPLGPAGGERDQAVLAVGQPYSPRERQATIV